MFKRVVVATVTMFFQQWTGINAVLYYVSDKSPRNPPFLIDGQTQEGQVSIKRLDVVQSAITIQCVRGNFTNLVPYLTRRPPASSSP
jgi:hypothetical protein